MELRDYQKEKAQIGLEILRNHNIVMLGFDPRVGKTLTAISIANDYGAEDVLFITKKKAIPSIQKDCDTLAEFDVTVINYESIHKVEKRVYDLVIIDESHNLSAMPRPGVRTKKVKEYVQDSPVIFLTGTPAPENYMQLYHQFWVTAYSPFLGANFYEFFKMYGCVAKEFDVGASHLKKDYSNKLSMIKKWYKKKSWTISKKDPNYENLIKKLREDCVQDLKRAKAANDAILAAVEPLIISLSREDAGFTQEAVHKKVWIDMPDDIRRLYNEMSKEGVVFGDSWISAASTAADKFGKMLQLCGGTILDDEGEMVIINDFKAREIEKRFAGLDKFAIFYKFRAERMLLEQVFEDFTDNPERFNSTDTRVFLGQFTSIKEGVDLRTSQCIVMYSADDSAAGLYQSMARLLSRDRTDPAPIYWIFCKGGREEKVFKNAMSKRVFTDRFKEMEKTLS